MLAVVCLTGTAVALVGKIAFVGLVIPHITRFLVGVDYRYIIPCAAVIGAFFLALCDVLSRVVNYPFETPIGVLTALVGVPFFLYLVRKHGGENVHKNLKFILFNHVDAYFIDFRCELFTYYKWCFDMSVMDVIKTLLRIESNSKFDLVIFEFRLPRIVIAGLVGIGLGMAGVVLQGITRNGLADPGILGINAGAGAAVVIFMFFFQLKLVSADMSSWMSILMMPLFGFIGGTIAAILIFSFALKMVIWICSD